MTEWQRHVINEDADIREGMHAHRGCAERCSATCPAPVFDDEEFYDGHLDYDGDDQ